MLRCSPRTVVLCATLSAIAAHSVERVSAVSTTLVIDEFRTRGPNGGNDEFIELRNVSDGAISLSGWNVLGSNGSGLTEFRANLQRDAERRVCLPPDELQHQWLKRLRPRRSDIRRRQVAR